MSNAVALASSAPPSTGRPANSRPAAANPANNAAEAIDVLPWARSSRGCSQISMAAQLIAQSPAKSTIVAASEAVLMSPTPPAKNRGQTKFQPRIPWRKSAGWRSDAAGNHRVHDPQINADGTQHDESTFQRGCRQAANREPTRAQYHGNPNRRNRLPVSPVETGAGAIFRNRATHLKRDRPNRSATRSRVTKGREPVGEEHENSAQKALATTPPPVARPSSGDWARARGVWALRTALPYYGRRESRAYI